VSESSTRKSSTKHGLDPRGPHGDDVLTAFFSKRMPVPARIAAFRYEPTPIAIRRVVHLGSWRQRQVSPRDRTDCHSPRPRNMRLDHSIAPLLSVANRHLRPGFPSDASLLSRMNHCRKIQPGTKRVLPARRCSHEMYLPGPGSRMACTRRGRAQAARRETAGSSTGTDGLPGDSPPACPGTPRRTPKGHLAYSLIWCLG
jgi:hypothetical protein